MNLKLSAPGKTFLVGEYSVLVQGPALLLNTEPRFELHAQKGSGRLEGIPVGSPAYRWLEQNAGVLRDWDIEFLDPHKGAGGFGASGAQFLFAHSLTTFLQASVGRALSGLDLGQLLESFHSVSEIRSSGADLLSLAVGQVAKLESGHVESCPWPFQNLEFAIVRTGRKIPTHAHIANLKIESLEGVAPLAAAVVQSFKCGARDEFLGHIKEFSRHLGKLGLLAEPTHAHLETLKKEEWCLASKGCGALGADTMLLFFAPENLEDAKAWARAQGLEFSASSAMLSAGLKMDWSWT